jgi:hypothetical protein
LASLLVVINLLKRGEETLAPLSSSIREHWLGLWPDLLRRILTRVVFIHCDLRIGTVTGG